MSGGIRDIGTYPQPCGYCCEPPGYCRCPAKDDAQAAPKARRARAGSPLSSRDPATAHD